MIESKTIRSFGVFVLKLLKLDTISWPDLGLRGNNKLKVSTYFYSKFNIESLWRIKLFNNLYFIFPYNVRTSECA